jgi:hypothetical protein
MDLSGELTSEQASPVADRASPVAADVHQPLVLQTEHVTPYGEPIYDPAADECRDNFRRELLGVSGCGTYATFRSIDLNGNGQLSLLEFADGMNRLCVDWQKATHLRTVKDVFRLFKNKDGEVTLQDLFPETRRVMTPPNRMSTPDFWNHWCRNTASDSQNRGAKWLAADQEEEIRTVLASTEKRQEAVNRKRWMSQTMRRMKSQGKSDARCRELCALHLPRGTGPRDRECVHGFSQREVKNCRKNYNDAVSHPMRNIQKQVYAMREQRLELQAARLEMRRMSQSNARIRKENHKRRSQGGMPPEMDNEDLDSEEEEDPLEESQDDFKDPGTPKLRDKLKAHFG